MAARTILNTSNPKTQSIDAIKALLSWQGRAADPLPSYLELGGGEGKVVLVLSNERDSYYTCTKSDCSCPASVYHRGPCKHRRKYFAGELTTGATKKSQGTDLIPRQQFKPFIEDAARPAKATASPSFEMVDTLGEPTAREVAYWSIQADREMWPAEA
jgi:hypothetical protein